LKPEHGRTSQQSPQITYQHFYLEKSIFLSEKLTLLTIPIIPVYVPLFSCKRSYYNIKKGALDSRTTSFGYDSKVDLINHEEVPAPGSYNHKDYFMSNRMKRSGYTFSLDRR